MNSMDRFEIAQELDMSREEENLWEYCYTNARTSELIGKWKKFILQECRQGLEAFRELGCRVSLPMTDYAAHLGNLLMYCSCGRMTTRQLQSVDKIVLAIVKKIGSEIQMELYSKFGDTCLSVDQVGIQIVINFIKLSDYRRYLGQCLQANGEAPNPPACFGRQI